MKLETTHNTLSPNIRGQSIELLNKLLAGAIDLHGQMKQAHWNVRGPAFIAVHELFDKVAEAAENYSDMLAERAAALGGTAEGGTQRVLDRTFLSPYPLGIAEEKSHIEAVSSVLGAFGGMVRQGIDDAANFGDAATSDLLTEVVRGIDLQLYFVESHNYGR